MLDRRPTPYEVWKEKNKPEVIKKSGASKLNVQQWYAPLLSIIIIVLSLLLLLVRDKLVDKMYAMNRAKQSTQAKGQNQGFASELGGYEFKPRMNKTSLDLGIIIIITLLSNH